MRVGFRHVDSRYPFLWEDSSQPAARWHEDGSGPTQYISETSDGAWAEFLRHEEITDPTELVGVARSLWAIQLPSDIDEAEQVSIAAAVGGPASYAACQAYASTRRKAGIAVLDVPSAALVAGGAGGQVTDRGLHEASAMDGRNWVLYGSYANMRGWRVIDAGAPPVRVLGLVRPLTPQSPCC